MVGVAEDSGLRETEIRPTFPFLLVTRLFLLLTTIFSVVDLLPLPASLFWFLHRRCDRCQGILFQTIVRLHRGWSYSKRVQVAGIGLLGSEFVKFSKRLQKFVPDNIRIVSERIIVVVGGSRVLREGSGIGRLTDGMRLNLLIAGQLGQSGRFISGLVGRVSSLTVVESVGVLTVVERVVIHLEQYCWNEEKGSESRPSSLKSKSLVSQHFGAGHRFASL